MYFSKNQVPFNWKKKLEVSLPFQNLLGNHTTINLWLPRSLNLNLTSFHLICRFLLIPSNPSHKRKLESLNLITFVNAHMHIVKFIFAINSCNNFAKNCNAKDYLKKLLNYSFTPVSPAFRFYCEYIKYEIRNRHNLFAKDIKWP